MPEFWEIVAEVACAGGTKRVRQSAADRLRREFGPMEEIVGGDALYPSETTWYFAPPAAYRQQLKRL